MPRTPLAIALLAAATPFALGQELWRQNPFNTCGGYSSQDARNPGGLGWFSECAEDFFAQADWRVGSVEFWGGYCTSDSMRGNTEGFAIRFYADAGNVPGAMIYEAEVTTFTEDIYAVIGTDLTGYRYTVELPLAFEPGAAGEYWMSVVAILPRGGSAVEPQWGWAESPEDFGSVMAQWFFNPFNFTPNPNNAELAFVLHAASDDGCGADLTGSSDPNDPSYGVPDGNADIADFFYFLDQFVANNLGEADLTGSSDPNDPSYGVPDGTLDGADFFFYLDLFVQGC